MAGLVQGFLPQAVVTYRDHRVNRTLNARPYVHVRRAFDAGIAAAKARVSSLWRRSSTVMACGSTIRNASALGLLLLAAAFAPPAAMASDQIKGTLEVKADDGYARFVFTIGDEVDASVHLAGSVLIVNFTKPVFVSVERLAALAPDYVSAARRDPDGKSIRMALARKVTVNATGAAEKFFVDLLPDTWSAPPPSLPSDVIEDLA